MQKIYTLVLLLTAFAASGQNYLMNNTAVTDCSGSFLDSGGSASGYGNNENFTKTFCSDNSSGTHVRLDFSGVDLAAGDELCFYDGTSTAATLLACASDYTPGQPFTVQATAVNNTGCLTVTFVSDGSGNGTGWSAALSCVASCQQVLADIVSANPPAVPADTGWIDVCPDERIFFVGQGIYPQNGQVYTQSDQTTTFEWNFGDGDIAYGPNVSHAYQNAGGYYVQLTLTDVNGCKSTNLIKQRVRVAPRPSFTLPGNFDNTICAGDTLSLASGFDSTSQSQIIVMPNTVGFATEGIRSDSLALPDGTGVGYETSIFFSQFSPGQVLTSASDLEGICVNMEHSWMRDIEISLTCPNGQSIILHNFGGQTGSQVFLGIPNDNDGFNPVPGIGWDYCWTPNATNPTWLQYANTTLGGSGTLPSGDYSPFEPFSDLIGCPLNGEWTITVTDLWPIDNGFIFSWSIGFLESLYPNIEEFTPQFVSWGWNNHPSIFYQTQDSISAAPQNAGTAGYTFHVTDELGCTWDTLVVVNVLPHTHPDCYSCNNNFKVLADTSICSGTDVVLDAGNLAPTSEEVRFEAYPDYQVGNANHPHNNPYASPIAVSSLGYNVLANPVTAITSVCVDLETDFDADIIMRLRAPDGKLLELTSGNGGSGDNYKITCFTPAAANPVTAGVAPFNGTYAPEGPWSNLTNALVNGDWELLVSDGFGPTKFGTVKWWSIGFNTQRTINYAWTNAATLSCNNCPNPVATPTATTTYVVTTIDNFNCQHRDTVTVDVSTFFPAPGNLAVTANGADFLTWSWTAVPGATGYEVSVNGGPWAPANGTLGHTVNGLVTGDSIHLDVRAIGGSPLCPPAVATDDATFTICSLGAMLDSVTPATCNGTATGSVVISVANANGTVSYVPNGIGPIFTNGNISNFFAAGDYFVAITDDSGCRDTVTFTIGEPPAVVAAATATGVLCNGGSTGSVTATGAGGTGALSFAWRSCGGGPVVNGATAANLTAGCYAVTATDINGCTDVDSVLVNEPEAINFITSQTPVNCFGGNDGTATVSPSGGAAPFTFLWENGATQATANNLAAGPHTVTVTDANQCQVITLVDVLSPTQLLVDSLSVQQVACFGGATGEISAFAIGGTMPYGYAWTGGQTGMKATALAAGSYTVTVTDANGCTTFGSAAVTAPADLVATVGTVQNQQCVGTCNGAVTLTVTGGTGTASYAWSQASIGNTPNAANLCPAAYSVTVTDANGCTETAQATVQAAQPINLSIADTPPSCANLADGSIGVTVQSGAGPFTYLWNNNATVASQTNIPCGPYTVTVTDTNGCTATLGQTIACPTTVQIQSVTPQNALCFGQASGSLTALAQGGTGTLTFAWSNGQSGATATNLPAGTYTVTATDANGCAGTSTGTVGQPQALTVSLTPTAVTCFGGNDGTLTAQPGGGTLPYAYAWNVGGATGPSLTNVPSNPFSVTVTDANGCTVTSSATVQQPATALSVTPVQTETACFGLSNAQAAATASGGNGAPFGYSWSTGQNTAAVIGLAAGTVTVTATDASGCTATQTLEIQQFDAIEATITTKPPSCFGYADGRASISTITGGAGPNTPQSYQYQWSQAGVGNTSLVTTLTGNANYSVTATDSEGCSNVFAFFLEQPGPVIPTLDVTPASCFGSADGRVCVASVQSDVPVITYLWSNGANTPCASDLAIGTYSVTVTNSDNCSGAGTMTVTQPTALSLALDVTQLKCSGNADGAIAVTADGGTPGYTYQWNDGDANPTRANLGSGNFTVTVTDANGCTESSQATLSEPDSLRLTSTGTDPTCFGLVNGRLRLDVEAGGTPPFRYALNDGAFGGSPTFLGLGAGTYTLVVRDANGCTSSVTDSLGQPLPVVVALGADTTLLFGDSLTLTPDVSNAFGLLAYTWRTALVETFACVDSADCAEIRIKPTSSNTYRVIITDANGCIGQDEINVRVEKPRAVYVPTGFSPNADGANDLLLVHGKSRLVEQIVAFRVFDRWGELVFEDGGFPINDDQRGWDGSFRGQACDPGVYVWIVEVQYADGFREVLKGNTTLIR